MAMAGMSDKGAVDRAGGGWARDEWRAGWPVLPPALAGVMLVAVHGYSLGVMVTPLQHAFGWSRAAITAGPFIIALVAFWAAPLTGLAIDRFGPRRVALLGVPAFCGALALLGTASANVLTWWALWALLGIASMMILPMVWTTAIAGRFSRNRGMALALALCGTGITATFMPTLTDRLVGAYGWRHAYVALGGLCCVVVLPLVLLSFRGRQEVTGGARPPSRMSRAELRRALTSRRFVLLAGAVTVNSFAMCALTVNGVPVLTGRGFGPAEAAAIAGLIGIGSVTGRLGGGLLLDRVDAARFVALCMALPAMGALLLLAVPHSTPAAQAACLLIGLCAGAEYDAAAYLAARHFGVDRYATMFGAVSGILLLSNGLAPLLANALFDATHSYDVVLWAQLPLGALAALLFLAIGPYPEDVDTVPGERPLDALAEPVRAASPTVA
jgi:MFS family permease